MCKVRTPIYTNFSSVTQTSLYAVIACSDWAPLILRSTFSASAIKRQHIMEGGGGAECKSILWGISVVLPKYFYLINKVVNLDNELSVNLDNDLTKWLTFHSWSSCLSRWWLQAVLEEMEYLHSFQSGFRPGFETEMALISLLGECWWSDSPGHLSSFDTTDHNIFLS